MEITEAEINQAKEMLSSGSYFFRLAAKEDPSFKVLTGSLDL